MLARAISGCTISPPSTASQALCTVILPEARSSEISATPAPSEPERSLIETPSARPCGRGAFQSDICATFSNTARARGLMFILSNRNCRRIHAFGRRHLVDERLDRVDVEHVADRRASASGGCRATRRATRCAGSAPGSRGCGCRSAAARRRRRPRSASSRSPCRPCPSADCRHWNACGRNMP